MSYARSGRSTMPAGQSYLATVSDLVSALIFVFVIMMAVFAYQLANVTEEQESVTAELTAGRETRDRILEAIADRLTDAGIRVDVLYEQGVLRLSDNAINFPLGGEVPIMEHHVNVGILAQAISAVLPCYVTSDRALAGFDLSPTAGSESSEAAETAAGAPWCQARRSVADYECQERRYPWLLETLLIEGHTDNVPVTAGRRFRDNLELSSMRAATVHRMIAACEPDIQGLRNTQGHPVLSTSGYGKTRPATQDPAKSNENRRIDLRLLLEPPEGVFAPGQIEFADELRQRMGTGS